MQKNILKLFNISYIEQNLQTLLLSDSCSKLLSAIEVFFFSPCKPPPFFLLIFGCNICISHFPALTRVYSSFAVSQGGSPGQHTKQAQYVTLLESSEAA